MRERSRSDSDSFKLKAARRPTCCRLPQRHWLDGDVSQATLVCFTGDADAFAGRIQRALAPWVPCDLSAINRTNASPHDERAARSRRLGETHRAWLRHEYRADLRLWNRTCL